MSLDTTLLQPTIATDRFVLRPPQTSDQGLLTHYASDKRVAAMTASVPHPLPPGTMEAFLQRAAAPDRIEDVWVMDATLSGGTEVMGLISLTRMDRGQSEVGFWVAPPFWNTHVARDALLALVAANPQGNCTMFASVFQDNTPSARVVTNCGFEYIGDAEAYSVARGANVPTWTYLKKLA
ncbi:GNAT family N-acetyltransferase [Litorisediminicola beolgyonensis]|uniref:GNAT family N-acetyltransferase n=1 Tax=Litorisediminicola beolgyonensis TaxID=1173614 RepID=A0ABW3ZDL0_9RHOB